MSDKTFLSLLAIFYGPLAVFIVVGLLMKLGVC